MIHRPLLAKIIGGVLLCLVVTSRAAHGEEADRSPTHPPPSVDRFFGFFGVFGRANPVGLALVTSVDYRRVFGVDAREGYETGYAEAGASVLVAPDYLEPGVHVEVLPAPFAILRVEANAFRFFGTLGGLLRFPTRGSTFDDDTFARLRGQEHVAWAERGAAVGTLRFKAGRFLLRNETTVALYHFNDPGPYLYEGEYDTLLARDDGILVDRLQVFFIPWNPSPDRILLVGPAYEVTRTFETHLNRERVGGAVFWMPMETLGAVKRPQLFANVGTNITDPNRTGGVFGIVGLAAEVE